MWEDCFRESTAEDSHRKWDGACGFWKEKGRTWGFRELFCHDMSDFQGCEEIREGERERAIYIRAQEARARDKPANIPPPPRHLNEQSTHDRPTHSILMSAINISTSTQPRTIYMRNSMSHFENANDTILLILSNASPSQCTCAHFEVYYKVVY
jgi:hypothetical protein